MAKNNKKTKVAIIIFLITAIIATALTAVLAFGDSNEGYRTITVIEIQGTVGVVHDNIEYSAYTGMHLEEGYTVVTGGNSYIRLLLDDDKYVKLESGTKAVFSEVSGGKTAINIERGSLVAEVTKPLQVDEDFIVNTPNAVLAVRGTLFRVDLSRNDKGELNTDVMTYGGAVSSKRIQPTGEVEDIEVTITEGFKATVNMDDKETVYLVDNIKIDLSALVGKPSGDNNSDNTTTETNVNGEIIENTPVTLESVLKPIVIEDIPDDDLVDIYFASENGHSMFIETKEIKAQVEERNIDVTQKTSVYEVAQKVKEPVEIVIPDDNKSLVTTTEPVTEAVAVIQGPPSDGIGETTTEVTTETTTELVTTTVPTTVTTTKAPSTTVPPTTVPTTTVPTTEQTTEPTTEEITVHTHTEIIEEVKATCTENGVKTVKCLTCGEIISETVLTATGHSEEITIKAPTCTETGKETVTCAVCGELISETVLDATGHSEIFSGAKDAHTECSVCYEVLSTSHNYTQSTTNASCTLDGGTTYVCECGYNYTDTITATGHTEVDGAAADIHTKCKTCGETLEDGTYHTYTDETTQNTCTTAGEVVHNCTCGWSYTEEIPAGHKKSDDGFTCSGCGGVWVDLNSTNFPDSMFLSYISTTYDSDGNNALIGDEVTGVVTINVSGNSTTDGGYTDLTGIENFTNLTTVNCAYNVGITSLDLSGLTNLVSLDITGLTGLETLNISGTGLDENKITGLDTCTALTEFNASGCADIKVLNLNNNNRLETVNLNGCSSLTTFTMGDDSKQYFLSSINLTNCNNLEILEINSATELKTLDFSDKTKIKSIDLGGCQGITYLAGLSGKTSLQFLDIAALNKITEIDVSSCSALTNISITACSSLQTINLGYSGITTFNGSTTTINLSSYTNLKNVYLNNLSEDNNSFATITLPTTNTLEVLSLSQNKNVTALDLSGKTVLKELMLSDVPKLSSLNITNGTALESLSLMNTGLTTLSVTASSALTKLNVYDNTALASFELTGATQLETAKLSAGMSNTVLTNLVLTNCGLTSLDVTYLTSLKTLDVSDCSSLETIIGMSDNITNLNVSGTKLSSVVLSGFANIATLNVTDCSSLTELNLTGCSTLSAVTGLDTCTVVDTLTLDGTLALGNFGLNSDTLKTVSAKNATFTSFGITSRSVTSIDLTGSTIGAGDMMSFSISSCGLSLETLIVSKTNLTTLPTETMSVLKTFKAENCTGLNSIDLATMPNIENLDISGCTGITAIDVSNCTSLKNLDVSGCTGLGDFDVSSNTELVSLNVSSTAITYLDASYNQILQSVDMSNCTQLTVFAMASGEPYNQLTSVNASGCIAMTDFQIENCSSLTTLDLSGLTSLYALYINSCTGITTLNVSNTALTSLDVGDCTNIASIDVTGTGITSARITLPAGKDESIITGLS